MHKSDLEPIMFLVRTQLNIFFILCFPFLQKIYFYFLKNKNLVLIVFYHPGEIGDWRNMFTEEQNRYFDTAFKSKMQDCILKFVWEKPENEESELKD